ncbi:class D beta-lactamase [Mesorhizobium sp. ZMM04-5]|uniref:Beta-lactamase n=1 Tax=Mesorhizobium marinum TaxID=3228790 RepID=A0ABV3R3F8_9HYPH
MADLSGLAGRTGTALGCLATAVVLAFAGSARADTICTVLADPASGKVLSQDGECDRRVPPASTFKIPISLMGYDAGFLQDATAPRLPFKQGYPDWRESWRTDIDPTSWMRESVVWYSQQFTQALGKEAFARYVEAFDYGNHDVSGDRGKDNGLTRSWLSSSLRISPLEQVGFLARVTGRTLPLEARAYEMTEAILGRHDLANGWTVRGKTGAGFSVKPDGTPDRQRPFGWYVGWASRDGRTIVFARLVERSAPQKMSPGLGARDAMLEELPSLLDAASGD